MIRFYDRRHPHSVKDFDVSVAYKAGDRRGRVLRLSFSKEAYASSFDSARFITVGRDPEHPTRLYFRPDNDGDGYLFSRSGNRLYGAIPRVCGDLADPARMCGLFNMRFDTNYGLYYIDSEDR